MELGLAQQVVGYNSINNRWFALLVALNILKNKKRIYHNGYNTR